MADNLATEKRKRVYAVDMKTRRLIAQGFEWKGRRFSLSHEAQNNLMMMTTMRDRAYFPLAFSTLDDSEVVNIHSTQELWQFVETATDRISSLLQQGRLLKRRILDAQTPLELNTILDDRL